MSTNLNNNCEHRIAIGLVQINNSFSSQNYLPYSVGLLQTYAQRYLSDKDRFVFLTPVHKRISIEDAQERLSGVDIAFFSTYIWNMEISLEIAKRIKRNRPEVIMVLGGPQVPSKNTEEFLRKYQFVDIACHGEGENTFLSILENYKNPDWNRLSSVSFIDDKGEFIRTPPYERISNLDGIPSPYLEGAFDSLIKANPDAQWVVLWETNRGCPFSCSYCDWGAATKNKIYTYDLKRLFREIDWFSQHRIEFVFCCDANFGILERDIEIVQYFAENKRRYGYPKAFSVQSTKNFTERSYKVYKIMSEAGLNKGVSLSLQSLNKDTLRETKRSNISPIAFNKIQQRLTLDNIETFTDLILGLPQETYESFVDGALAVIENGQHNRIQFNNLVILPNSEMGDYEYQKKFGFDIAETRLINIHGSLGDGEQVYETQQLVIGTSTMPKADWVKTRAFGWMVSLLHFDKLLQVPFIILYNLYHVRFRDLIEIFIDNNSKAPILSDIYSFFIWKATDIQRGGVEYCESKEWLNICWPADELILIKLCTEDKLKGFYKEAEQLLEHFLRRKEKLDYQIIIQESIMLNQNLIKLPFQEHDSSIRLSYNIWDVYYAALRGMKVSLQAGEYYYKIDRASTKWLSWEDWCREVVWYGNKKGAYIYNCKPCDESAETVEIK